MIILQYHEIFFRLTAPRCPSTAAGAVSLKNLTKCEEVRKGADQAICNCKNSKSWVCIWPGTWDQEGRTPLKLRFNRVKIFKMGKIFFLLFDPPSSPLGKDHFQGPAYDLLEFKNRPRNQTRAYMVWNSYASLFDPCLEKKCTYTHLQSL